MSSRPCWWTRTIAFSLAPFARPPVFVHFTIVIYVSRDWLKTTYELRNQIIISLSALNNLLITRKDKGKFSKNLNSSFCTAPFLSGSSCEQ